jgi:tetratricopeptide (TPR) repeat protein
VTGKGRTSNEISGGFFFSAVVQGRDITVVLQPKVESALVGPPDASKVFTGRDTDLKQLLELLDPAGSEAALVQVSAVEGLAGVGKTELVLQAVHAAVRNGWFPGGVLFVDMFAYEPKRKVEAGTALEGMLRAAGIRGENIPDEVQDRSRLFSSVMAAYAKEGRSVLVVVDNVASSAEARPLLPAGGKAVVTSRHTLADLDARLLELHPLTPQAGAKLLAGRLTLARGAGDKRVADHPDDALLIARLCAGLPLALRIVAALLAAHPTRPLSSMAADLHDARTRVDEIRYGGADDGVAVRSAFDLSYRQLDSQQARTFRLLALNPGPEISTEATSAVTALDQRTTRRHLEELARAHLIEAGSSYGRWRMHDLIRLYAAQPSDTKVDDDDDDWAEALTQLLLYYLNTAQAATSHLHPTVVPAAGGRFLDRTQALEWLDTEYPNLTAVARLNFLSHVAADLTLDLWRFFESRRYFDDWITLTTRALRIARQLQDRQREAEALVSLGGALRHARRFDDAIAACQEAAAIRRETGDQRGEGIALNNLAAAQAVSGRFEEAISTHQQAAAIFREAGDRHRQGIALNNLGGALLGAKRFEEAITAYKDAAALFRKSGDRHGEGGALSNLGNALQQAGQSEEAITTHQRAVAIFREAGDRHAEGIALHNLGAALITAKRFEEAIAAERGAAVIFRESGDRHREGGALANLGNALQQMGRLEEAITALVDAATAYRESDDRRSEGEVLDVLGSTLWRAGRWEEAIIPLRDAAQRFHETGDRHNEGKALSLLGTVLGQGRLEEAITAFRDAAQLFHETGDRRNERAMLEIVERFQATKRQWDANFALLKAGRFEEVITDLQKLAPFLHQVGDRYGEGVVLTRLGIALVGLSRFEDAITALQEAASIFRENGDRHREGIALHNLGGAQLGAKHLKEAITAYQGAAAIFEETGDRHRESIAVNSLAAAQAAAGRCDEAITTDQGAVHSPHDT